MTPRAQRRLAMAMAGAVLGVLAGGAVADEGPVVLGRREPTPMLSLDPITGSLGFNGIYQSDSTKSAGQNTSTSDTLLQEQLTLATGGGVVSRNLIDWHASVTAGLNEEWLHAPSQTGASYGYLTAYNISATGLKTTQFPVSVFAQRGEEYVNRSFAGLLKDTVSTYGGVFSYRSPTLPTTLRISHSDTTQADLGGAVQYTQKENDLDLSTQYQPGERQQLTLNYHYSTVDQVDPGLLTNNYQSQSVDATHTWGIDANGHFLLTQSLNYDQQSGMSAYSHLRLDERLDIHHTKELQTFLDYTLDQQKFIDSTNTMNRVSGGFTHQLYESLTTNGNVGVSQTNRTFSGTSSDSSSSEEFYGNLNLNYTKKVPLGLLGANLSLGYDQTNNGAIGAEQNIRGDQQSFTDPQPIILTQPGLSAGSISVFNAARTHQYLSGIDYLVHPVGNTVQIERVVGGNINPGDTVSLDYGINPLPGYTLTTTNFGMGVRYDFQEGLLNGLGLYGQYSQQDQAISGTTDTIIRPDNVRDTLFGAEYRVWKLTLRAEQENRESTLAPADSTRFTATYLDRLGARTTANINLNQTFITYPDVGGKTSFTTIDGRLDYEIQRDLHASYTLRWRNDQDTRFGSTMGFENEGELTYKLRQTEVFLMVRHTYLKSDEVTDTSLLFQFGVTRHF